MIRREGILTALITRKDRSPTVLRKLVKAECDPRVARRLLAIANALSGMSRKEAAEAGGMDRQTLRDWVIRYNAHGPDGLYDCWGDGRPPRLEAHEQAELIRIVLAGPGAESGLSAFTREDLARICEARFGKTFHPASLGRLLKRLGFSRQKARPAIPKKTWPKQRPLKGAPALLKNIQYTHKDKRLRLVFQDEARRGFATSASPSPISSRPWSHALTMPSHW
ncbi:MAG: helix-turn-helix domain-containing protein [Rhodomicrobium sp.]